MQSGNYRNLNQDRDEVGNVAGELGAAEAEDVRSAGREGAACADTRTLNEMDVLVRGNSLCQSLFHVEPCECECECEAEDPLCGKGSTWNRPTDLAQFGASTELVQSGKKQEIGSGKRIVFHHQATFVSA